MALFHLDSVGLCRCCWCNSPLVGIISAACGVTVMSHYPVGITTSWSWSAFTFGSPFNKLVVNKIYWRITIASCNWGWNFFSLNELNRKPKLKVCQFKNAALVF
jgi:hypothetical protein